MRWGPAKAVPKANLRPAASEVCIEQNPKAHLQLQNQLNFFPPLLSHCESKTFSYPNTGQIRLHGPIFSGPISCVKLLDLYSSFSDLVYLLLFQCT
jgi:hypothetical protein